MVHLNHLSYFQPMKAEDNYIEINKQSWNSRVEYHVDSEFYNLEKFLKGETSLNPIELALLGDLKGNSILHLQCHFGQDTISLARMGAKVTGVDLSDKAIEKARELAKQCNVSADFVSCDIYDLPNHLEEKFDIIFTSYGTIGWLPDLDKWAAVVSSFLKPGGKFVFVEFHPVVWMFDSNFEKVAYNYFKDGAIVETESGSYANREAGKPQEYVSWNHSISEVVNSLLGNGLTLQSLNEYDYSPYPCFQHVVEVAPKQFRIKHLDNKIPMVYSIEAAK